MLTDEMVEQFQKAINSPTRMLKEKADLVSYSYDGSFGTYLPELVIQPMSTQEVVSIVKVANQYRVPLYPRGRGTSLSGGPLPVHGGVVLDFSQWNQKLEIDSDDTIAVVSPGVLTAEIDKAAKNMG